MTEPKAVQPTGDGRAGQVVATALRAELARQKLTPTDLAGRLVADGKHPRTPVDPRYVLRRANGQVPMTIDDVQWFAKALELPMNDLLVGIHQLG